MTTKKQKNSVNKLLIYFLLVLLTVVVVSQLVLKLNYSLTTQAQDIHDVAITMVTVSQNSVVQGETVYINVTAENQGDFTETFNVTVYADSAMVDLPQTVSDLPPNASIMLFFTWNTSTVSEGIYTIKATASTVPFEMDITDNTYTNGNVAVKITVVAGLSDFYQSTNLPFQQKAFYALGRHWVFYSDYKNMVYVTSEYGKNWSTPTVVREAMYGFLFSIWFDGTYVHYAYRDHTQGILYRRGLPDTNGTITWETEHLVVEGVFWAPTICVDSNGYPWIGYRTNYVGVPADTKPYVIKSTATNGSSWDAPIQLSELDELWWTMVTPLTAGKVYVLYSYPEGPIYGNLWNGTSWLAIEETATAINSTIRSYGVFSSVAYGDDVYLVYLQNFTRNIIFINRTYGVGWGEELILATFEPDEIVYPEPPSPRPTISIDPAKGDIYVRWIEDVLYQVRYDAVFGAWEAIETPFGTIFNSPDPRSLSSYYQKWDSKIGSAWVEGTTAPYEVTYAFEDV